MFNVCACVRCCCCLTCLCNVVVIYGVKLYGLLCVWGGDKCVFVCGSLVYACGCVLVCELLSGVACCLCVCVNVLNACALL